MLYIADLVFVSKLKFYKSLSLARIGVCRNDDKIHTALVLNTEGILGRNESREIFF